MSSSYALGTPRCGHPQCFGQRSTEAPLASTQQLQKVASQTQKTVQTDWHFERVMGIQNLTEVLHFPPVQLREHVFCDDPDNGRIDPTFNEPSPFAMSPIVVKSCAGNPRLDLSAARPSANCSRMASCTISCILRASSVMMDVFPTVGWDLLCVVDDVSVRRSIVPSVVPLGLPVTLPVPCITFVLCPVPLRNNWYRVYPPRGNIYIQWCTGLQVMIQVMVQGLVPLTHEH